MGESNQLQLLPPEYPPNYQEEEALLLYEDPLSEFYNSAYQNFGITFKSNEKGVKNPTQVISDDTLYVMPKKNVCIYLGDQIVPLDGCPPPRVVAYLKFADDARKNEMVSRCEKHQSQDENVMVSENIGVTTGYDETRLAYALNFEYPQGEVPAISLSFVCSSSCFGRCTFELIVELDYQDFIISQQKHLVKVSSNPGRDSGHQLYAIANDFLRIGNAFTVSKCRSRKRPSISEPEATTSAKRSVSHGQQQIPELPANNVYTLHIYGFEAYQTILKQHSMLTKNDKYDALKGPPTQRGLLLNSQIPPEDSLDAWLTKIHMRKHRNLLNGNNIGTMLELYNAYHPQVFESLGIPLEDARALHLSFIYWQTSFLHNIYKDIKTDATGNVNVTENDNVETD